MQSTNILQLLAPKRSRDMAPPDHHTNGSTTTPLVIITEFSHLTNQLQYFQSGSVPYTNGSTITPLNIETEFSHKTNGSTTTPLDIETEFSHHPNGSPITPLVITTKLYHLTNPSQYFHPVSEPDTNGSTITPLNIPTKFSHDTTSSTTTPLDIATEFSHHDPTFARLNNGSFGCCPSTIISAQKKWQLKFLENPDYFYFNTLQPALLRSRHRIKSLINANHVDEISIVDNVTTAAAIVLTDTAWSFFTGHFHPGDAVLLLQKAYGAIKNSVAAYVSRAGGHVIEVPLPFPLNSNEQIMHAFKKALEMGKSNGRQRIKLAVIDHVTSMPSVVIPVKELVSLCRDEGVEQIFVDGAHGIGCVEVDVQDIGADFYTSSLYKWFFCPPAATFLYCKKSDNARTLHHPVVSHDYGKGLAIECGWIGTRDYSAQCVIPEVLEFMMTKFEGGIDGIKNMNHEKVVEMAEMLAEEWGTGLGAPPEMFASMVMVGLPHCLGISSDADAWNLFENLRNCFGILAPVYYREPLEGDGVDVITGYVRISHQVYNTIGDYCRLKDAINKLVNDGFTYKATKHHQIIF